MDPPVSTQNSIAKDPCGVCKGDHFIAHCPAYLQSTLSHKEGVVKQLQLYKNCLRLHPASPSCPSKYRCRVCRADHHTTLHRGTPAGEFLPPGPRPQLALSATPGQQRTPQSYVSMVGNPILLGTAQVLLQSSTGLSHDVRVLNDLASEGHMLTERVVQLLRLRKSTTQTNVKGVGGVTTRASSFTTAAIRPKTNSNFVLSFSAMVLPKITSLLPSTRVQRQSWPHLQGIELADPDFHLPTEVDGILGADIYSLIIQEELRIGEPGSPVGQLTKLGWILTGPTGQHLESTTREVSSFIVTMQPAASVAEELRRFWELEEVTSAHTLTPDERYCEDRFVRTHERDAFGRYVLRLPFKATPTLDSNRNTAVARILQVERRLSRDAALAKQYHRFMDEYEQLDHLENIPAEHIDDRPHWYIPHHAIMQTKLRVVFDGSCGSPSLNDCLHSGAKLQLDISAVILRWRLLRFGFTSDVVKMYRQIRIHPDDTDWLRIVMRASPDQALADKRLLTVTYGTSCAPFQALRTMLQLAEDEGAELPLGADVLRKHIYVGDAYAGGDTLEEARAVRDQFIEILRRAGMSLDKWAANTRDLLPESVSSSSEHIFDPENTVSTLGLKWTPHSDEFSFAVRDPPEHDVITKRIVLSEIARLHDLFGLFAPVTVRAKMLLQMLWLSDKD